jgi:hypothetical protein
VIEISSFIQDLKLELFCDNSLFCDMLSLTVSEFEKKKKKELFTFNEVEKIATFFNVNVDDVIRGNVDFNWVRNNYLTPSNNVPDEFLSQGGTYISSIRAMINFVESSYNSLAAEYIMNKLKISRQALQNNSLMVNLKLGNKVLELINEITELDDYSNMILASHSYTTKQRKTFLELPRFKTSKQAVTYMCDNSNKYETNFTYSMRTIDRSTFVLQSISKESTSRMFGFKHTSSMLANKYKATSIKALTYLMGGSPLDLFYVDDYIKNKRHHVDYYVKDSRQTYLLQ